MAEPPQLDPLVSNGLASPTCRRADLANLAPASRRNCETSGFVAAGAPTGDYGIDVHIDTGVLGLSSGGLLSAVQDLLVTPVWMALVWAVHALVVMLEWCFSIDLLAGANTGVVGRGLRGMEAAFTGPWLPLALTAASLLAAYHGLVRRRVAETAGHVALMAAMMIAGLWVIFDPAGTVGAVGEWASQAAIGTLATAARGSPSQPERTFAGSLETVFSEAVGAPWCYLEFGDVEWCRQPARLDPGLRRAALGIAAREQAEIGCGAGASDAPSCAAEGSAQALALRRSVQLLRSAQTNGEIFLALPANGPARNSINEEASLLHAICRSSQATSCRGASAAQAEFRTNGSTWSRVGGLVLILAGALGMLLLLGFLALRLLAAAIFTLVYLLLAPLMVLAPAFGDGGRAAFRRWGTQLFGAVVAKLLYAFLLGVVLAALATISRLSGIGWWTQWLLMSALWWGAFVRRHQMLAYGQQVAGAGVPDRPVARRIGGLRTRAGVAAAGWVRRRHAEHRAGRSETPEKDPSADAGRGPRIERREETIVQPREPQANETPKRGPRPRRTPPGDPQPRRTAVADAQSNQPPPADAHPPAIAIATRLAAKRDQLERIARARGDAAQAEEGRRAAKLALRAERVRGEIGDLATDGGETRPRTGPQRRPDLVRRRQDLVRRREELARRREDLALGDSTREHAPESSVMRDIREVEAGRKRQLGFGKP